LAATFTSGRCLPYWFGCGMCCRTLPSPIGTSAGVRDPGAVAAVGHFAQLVLAHLLQRRLVRGRIVLDRDLRGHAAHRRRAAPVAGLHQQQRVAAHERRGHRHLRAVGEAEILVAANFLMQEKM
jgi:hypothetical protein